MYSIAKITLVLEKMVMYLENRSCRQSVSQLSKVSLMNNRVKAIVTIARNNSNTNRDVKQVEVTRRFQHVAGYLSDDTLICTVTTNGIMNLQIGIQDVKVMTAILGKSQYAIVGNSV